MARDLLERMGWKDGLSGRCIALPETLAPLFGRVAGGGSDWIAAACPDAGGVAARAADTLPLYRRGGHLWLLYPKRSGRIATDITRDRGWGPVEAAGFLGVTQVAVDADWSALRFRLRDEIPRLTRRGEA
jgi:hypothetical protein